MFVILKKSSESQNTSEWLDGKAVVIPISLMNGSVAFTSEKRNKTLVSGLMARR